MRTDRSPARSPLDATGLRLAIVVARFNDGVTGRLRRAAEDALREGAAFVVETFEVPGAFELPLAARLAAASGRFDAVVCLGCVIRGETPHFEYISSAVAHGVMDAMGATGVPIAFGVLTTDTPEQALARSGPGAGNKGFEAAAAAVELARVVARLGPLPAAGRRA